MELTEVMRWFDTFVGVTLTLESIIFITSAVIRFIDGKYYKVDLKKYINLLDDIIGAIDKPIGIIFLIWLIVSLGITFIK